jgi:protease-4
MQNRLRLLLLMLTIACTGCFGAKIKIFPDAAEPLREFTLSGEADGKVLLIPVRGIISDEMREGLVATKPSLVQEVVAHLQKAEQDRQVKAVVLKIDTPGGSATASDVLYHELRGFKERRQVKLVAAMMGLATSGGYYISLPADRIVAHPTTVTGSVGVILLRPRIDDLMEKIGVEVQVQKSGPNKDMASPFRESTAAERRILQEMTDTLGRRFLDLVKTHRQIDENGMTRIATARVFHADQARALGLIDEIGYLDDAVARAKTLAGLPENAQVVVYRRTEFPDDNLYNTATLQTNPGRLSLVDLGLPVSLAVSTPGFYYLWLPAAGND